MDVKVVVATGSPKFHQLIHVYTSHIVVDASVHSSEGVKCLFLMKYCTEIEWQFRDSHLPLCVEEAVIP